MIGWKVTDDDDDEHARTNIHALSAIRTHGLSVQAIKAYVSDRAATGTGRVCCYNRCHGNAVMRFWASWDDIYECLLLQ
jgi:hypothetical protein